MSDVLTAEISGWPVEPALVEAWRGFAVQRENPFLSPDWLEACVAELGETARIVVCHRGGELAGVIPLVEGTHGRARTLRFPGGGAGDLFEPACAREDEEEVGAAAARALAEDDGWDLLELDRMIDGERLLGAMMRSWPGRGRTRALRARRSDFYPYLEYGEEGFDAWLSGRGERVRKDFGKRVRKLERAGATVRTSNDEADLDRDFDVLERLHDARWGSESEAMGAALSRLHRSFAGATLRNGWLRMTVMELEAEPVAAMYAWRLGGRYMQYIGGTDPARSRLGVGTALLSVTIRAAAEEGASVYDLMRGEEEYKRRVESGKRESFSYLIARPGSRAARSALLEERAKDLGRRLPERPRSLARALYRKLRG